MEWKLGYIYISVKDTDKAANHYCEMMGAKILWRVAKFGAVVAAVETAPGEPILLLNDHNRPPRAELIFVVDDAAEAQKQLKKSGARNLSDAEEGPTGMMATFTDLDGNPICVVDHGHLDAFLSRVQGKREN
ncbi:MAG: VOC family protein [bacterium]